jgi:DNA invertase Pin-like site-specific DNA recombinase
MTRKVASPAKVIRCAIYTRKSSEEGLDQSFNSLHAQHEACEAYVKSQVAEGWKVLPTAYDDGGFSGGNLARPGLEKLLADVDGGRIDIVVVYKVDRLTRSLSDFAKIVDRLDAAGASFVSVTQAFNTTNSMGRLTLNVLLSFAQFEREVTGERIRDKIAASKAKGMWMGGNLPLGYDAPIDPQTRALVVNPAEAETVRRIFQTYLELGSVHALEARLDADGIRSKRWVAKNGRSIGGVRLSRGALFHLLKNRVYLGEIPHGEKSYPGCHPAIIDPDVFEAAKTLLAGNRGAWKQRPLRSATMALKGLLFDLDGAPMSPSFTHGKSGQVYRYYVSSPLQLGRPTRPDPDAVRRVSAPEIEELLQHHLAGRVQAPDGADLRTLLMAVTRVEVGAAAVRVTLLKTRLLRAGLAGCEVMIEDPNLAILSLPIRCKLRGGRTWLVPPDGSAHGRNARRDPALIRGLRLGHRIAGALGWSAVDGALAATDIKAPSNAYERRICRLAFLAPDIQRLILEGSQPPGFNMELLVHGPIPTSWAAQRRAFGFPER